MHKKNKFIWFLCYVCVGYVGYAKLLHSLKFIFHKIEFDGTNLYKEKYIFGVN